MWKRIGIILCICFLAACSDASEEPTLEKDALLAKGYLEERGYEIVSYEGGGTSRFEKQDLLESPVRDTWSVQTPISGVTLSESISSSVTIRSMILKSSDRRTS